jgi:PAS domain S-box-containing protein
MMEASREPEILGILLIVQNALCALEALDGAGALVERSLLCIPGLRAARVKLDADPSCPPCSSADGVNRTLPIATLHRFFGHVEVELTDEAAFRAYEPFVDNMMSTLALLLENRCQRRQLQTELARREELVHERTAALRTSNAQRDLALEAAKLGEWALDLTTYQVRRTRRHDLIFGYDPMLPEWTYELFLEHVHPEDRSEIDAKVQHAIRSGEHYDAEFRIRRSDGALRWLWARGSVLRESSGAPAHFFGLVQDITDKKQAEEEREALLAREQRARQQAEEAMRIKDQFLATVSHELRTPLTAVLGWVTILQGQGKAPDAVQKGLEIIGRNVRAQVRIVEDILDISRIVTGKLRIELQGVSLDDVVRNTIEIVAPCVSAKHLTLHYHRSEDPCVVFGDPTRLQQIVWNLLSNATKFTPNEGRIDVMLRLEAEVVSLRVIDTGIGIAPDCLPHVFERFWQADASKTRAYGGLGLGLAIVRHLAELHGGSIEVESAGAGCGASFTLRLPAYECSAAVTKESSCPGDREP